MSTTNVSLALLVAEADVQPRAARRRKTLPPRLRFAVLRRDGFRCCYCGRHASEVPLTVDHVVPVAAGGSDDPSNLRAACRECNAGKGSEVTLPDGAARTVAASRALKRPSDTVKVPGMDWQTFTVKPIADLTAADLQLLTLWLDGEIARADMRRERLIRRRTWFAALRAALLDKRNGPER